MQLGDHSVDGVYRRCSKTSPSNPDHSHDFHSGLDRSLVCDDRFDLGTSCTSGVDSAGGTVEHADADYRREGSEEGAVERVRRDSALDFRV